MPRWLDNVYCLIRFFALISTALCLEAGTLNVDLNGLKLGIDDHTGGIVYLASLYTGTILTSGAASAGLVDLAYPVKEFYPLRLASRYSHARVTNSEREVKISYESLGPSRDGVLARAPSVSATVSLRAAPDGRSVILSCTIKNDSGLPIRQVLFPDLSGLRPFLGADDTVLRFASGVIRPFAGSVVASDSAPFYVDKAWKTYEAGGYYGINTLRWIDIGGYQSGLSIFEARWGTDYPPAVLTHRPESDPTGLRLVWEHREQILPGQEWQSAEYWLTPHAGGWAKGIEVFRSYVGGANAGRPLPKHVAEGLGFRMLWMTETLESDTSRAYFHYNDLLRVAEDAKSAGIDEIVLWGWSEFFSPRNTVVLKQLGAVTELLEGIRKARSIAVNIAPFFSIQTVLNEYAERYRAKPNTSKWTYHSELVPSFNPFYVDAAAGAWVESDNPIWRRDVEDMLIQWISAGSPSICYDQFSSAVPSDPKSSFLNLASRLRARARKLDAESTFCGESIAPGGLERDGRILDYTWNWVDYEDSAPVLNVLRAPRLNCNVDHSVLEAEKCFSAGLYLNLMPRKPDDANGSSLLGDYPAFAENVRELAALRKQFLPFFLEGTNIGDSILRRATNGFVRAYQLRDRLLIIVVNDAQEPTAVGIPTDLSMWLPPAQSYRVSTYSADGKLVAKTTASPDWQGRTSVLSPSGMAFFEIARVNHE